jgi:hypothetical protein
MNAPLRLLLGLALGHLLLLMAIAQPAFPTNVVALVQHGTVTLAWDRAASHTNLASFGVLIGVASGAYNVRQEQATNTTTATVTNLAPGRYFFAVTARNVAGLDSDPSNEISVAIEKPPAVPSVRTVGVRAVLEGGTYPGGPWVGVIEWPAVALLASSEHRFFRVKLDVGPGVAVMP